MTSTPAAGSSSPLGATVVDGGVNFSLFSRTATGVELLLFDREDDAGPPGSCPLDPATNRTYHYWHVFVPGVQAGTDLRLPGRGPSAPANGLRFDPAKVLLDPYGRGVVVPNELRPRSGEAAGRQRRDGDEKRRRRSGGLRLGGRRAAVPARRHAPSFTRCTSAASRATRIPASARRTRGTYAGLIEKIPYLQQLGITAVELLPVFQFDAQDCPPGKGQLLGLCAGLVLRPAPGVQLAAGSARPGGRISRHGQGAAPGGHRSHSRRGVQPHRGGRPHRADALFPRHR